MGEIINKYTIVMWFGTLATIPTGWQICDGTNGTPDLRGYFVKGAAAGNAGDDTNHGTSTHGHEIDVGTNTGVATQMGTGANRAGTHLHVATTDTPNHEPPYKHLVFIMKL